MKVLYGKGWMDSFSYYPLIFIIILLTEILCLRQFISEMFSDILCELHKIYKRFNVYLYANDVVFDINTLY